MRQKTQRDRTAGNRKERSGGDEGQEWRAWRFSEAIE
jgi:hypothetical protein